jgi:hypothetical protein
MFDSPTGPRNIVSWVLWVDEQLRERFPVIYWTSAGLKAGTVAYKTFQTLAKNHTNTYDLYRTVDIRVTSSYVGEDGDLRSVKELKPGARPVGRVYLDESFFTFEEVRATAEHDASAQYGESLSLWQVR